MRTVATIGILIGTLAVVSLPARAGDDAIGFATGRLGGTAGTDIKQARAASTQRGSLPRVGSEAYAGFAQGGAYVQTCSHSGGPKSGNWACR
jgi:hypothetical protein